MTEGKLEKFTLSAIPGGGEGGEEEEDKEDEKQMIRQKMAERSESH